MKNFILCGYSEFTDILYQIKLKENPSIDDIRNSLIRLPNSEREPAVLIATSERVVRHEQLKAVSSRHGRSSHNSYKLPDDSDYVIVYGFDGELPNLLLEDKYEEWIRNDCESALKALSEFTCS